MTIHIVDNPLVTLAPVSKPNEMRMPLIQCAPGSLRRKIAVSVTSASAISSFWGGITGGPNEYSTEGFYYKRWTGSSQNLVVDLQGQGGIVTHIMTPQINGDSIVKLTMVIDGVKTYAEYSIEGGLRMCMGGFRHGTLPYSSSTVNRTTEFGSYADHGWAASGATESLCMSPVQTVTEGIGIPFKESLYIDLNPVSATYSGYITSNVYRYNGLITIMRQPSQ